MSKLMSKSITSQNIGKKTVKGSQSLKISLNVSTRKMVLLKKAEARRKCKTAVSKTCPNPVSACLLVLLPLSLESTNMLKEPCTG